MLVKLHANAVTTPRTRAYIQASSASVAELAAELGVGETTIRRWKGRTQTADRSHVPHRLATRFSAEEEEIVVELRTRLRLSLDDTLEVMRRCVRADISRSALHRCCKRRGVAVRPAPPPEQSPEQPPERPPERPGAPARPFRPEPFGYVHVDLKHLTRLQGRPAYVFVAVERTTRFAHVEVIHERSAAVVAACLERFLQAFGHPVHTILTDNGSEFTDRFGAARWGSREAGSGDHAFDRVCARHHIVHRLTRPYHPQTNGMVERFNRRIGEALAARPLTTANTGRNRFHTHTERNAFIEAFVASYNRTRLHCLQYQAPLEALAKLTGHNTKAGTQDFGEDGPVANGAKALGSRVRGNERRKGSA